MTGSADPSDFQWLAVIVVMPVCSRVTAKLAWLSVRVSFAGLDYCQNFGAIDWIAVITLSESCLNSFAVALVEGARERLLQLPTGRAQVAASLRAKATNCLDGLKLLPAVFAGSGVKFGHALV